MRKASGTREYGLGPHSIQQALLSRSLAYQLMLAGMQARCSQSSYCRPHAPLPQHPSKPIVRQSSRRRRVARGTDVPGPVPTYPSAPYASPSHKPLASIVGCCPFVIQPRADVASRIVLVVQGRYSRAPAHETPTNGRHLLQLRSNTVASTARVCFPSRSSTPVPANRTSCMQK